MDFRERLVEKLRDRMAASEAACLLLCKPENTSYVSGYFPRGPLFIIVPQEEAPVAVVSFFEESFMRRETWLSELQTYESFKLTERVDASQEALKQVSEALKKLGLAKGPIATDNLGLEATLKGLLSEVIFRDFAKELDEMRAVRLPEELEFIRQAASIADMGHEAFLDACVEGAAEVEVQLKAQEAMVMRGYELHPLGARGAGIGVVGAGLGSGRWPYWAMMTPTTRRLREGDMLIADGGAQLQCGYSSDMARTALVGRPSSKQRGMYAAALDANKAGVKALRPGVKASEVDGVMRQVIAEHGYGEHAFTVWGGHEIGLGLTFFIAPFDHTVLKAGMVTCLEPGIYIPEEGGVRIEDMVLITDSGAEALTKCRKELG